MTTTPIFQSIVPVQPMVPMQTIVPVQPMVSTQSGIPVQSVFPFQPQQPPWRKKFPTVFSGILSFLQFGITVVILGLEIGSMLIDMVTATIYVGLWAGLFFMCAWISQAASSCCCRGRGCATYTLITQCVSLFFAACVIGFDSYYLINPTTCFFSSSICNGLGFSRGIFYTYANFYNIKIPLIKAQLAAGCVMFVLCLISIVIYIITSIRVYGVNKPSMIYPPQQHLLPAAPIGSDGMITAPPLMNIRPARSGSPLYHRPMIIVDNGEGRTNDLLCPTCSTMMAVTVKKRPPQ